jgi:hypothetical protein
MLEIISVFEKKKNIVIESSNLVFHFILPHTLLYTSFWKQSKKKNEKKISSLMEKKKFLVNRMSFKKIKI